MMFQAQTGTIPQVEGLETRFMQYTTSMNVLRKQHEVLLVYKTDPFVTLRAMNSVFNHAKNKDNSGLEKAH